VKVATCDGDTPFEGQRWVQDHADVVLTNPDYLHVGLLPNHRRWVRLLRGLRLSRFPLNFGGGLCGRQAAITGSS